MRSGFRGIFLLVFHLLIVVLATSGQVGNSGSIEGTVKDPSGAVVPGAQVAAVLEDTNVSRSTISRLSA